MEFSGSRPSYAARVRSNWAKCQLHPAQNPGVGVVHALIGFGERIHRGVKGISIFHDEFACSQHAKTWSRLISKLRLNLVIVNRQLLMAF